MIELVGSGICKGINPSHISHELLARYADFLRQGSTEHHDLLVVGSCSKDFLNVATHVWWAMSKLDDLVAKQLQGKEKVEELKHAWLRRVDSTVVDGK